ncbi:MAG: amidohydrolase family protein [Bacteroidaceae bacterium]|nr:amidohydrolase family protein [Bacteroidaceae bacterium]
MQKRCFVLKGNIAFSMADRSLALHPNSHLVCEDGRCAGVFASLPERYSSLPLTDYGDRIIIPGMTDLHIHAPQFAFRGLGMDRELMEWLENYTYPEESHYADLDYAERAYAIFARHLRRSATTRACIFATVHRRATTLLMDKLEASGLITLVGKVNMDRLSPDFIRETTDASIAETRLWIEETANKYERTRPIITPRFIPTCTPSLLNALGAIAQSHALPIQSHLSENLGEIALVREFEPDSPTYGHAYDKYGLLGSENSPCVMAHCVHSSDAELALLKHRGVFIAHSPESNMNVSSGIAPIARYLSMGLRVGLASDVAGGSSECLFAAMAHAIQASHLYWRLVDSTQPQLTFADAFFLATRSGGAFFGKVGAFEHDFDFDALVIDDSDTETTRPLSLAERLERLPYHASWRNIVAKYVAGTNLLSET